VESVDAAARKCLKSRLGRWHGRPALALIIRWSKVQILQGPPDPSNAYRLVRTLRRRAGGGAYNEGVHLSIELDREDDGRWIAEALELPGVMTYGQTREEAIGNTERLAIEVIADRIKHAELPPSALNVSFQVLSERLAGD
jgi:predicted RNase H-like HicB family nuclease